MENGKVRVQTLFTYAAPAISLAAGASGSSILRIESATDFIWFKGTYWADLDGTPGNQTESSRIVPSVDVQMQVSGSDRNLFQEALPVPAFFGTGQIPLVLPKPMVLLANSEIRFDFESREATRDIRLVLTLSGLKDFGELSRANPSQNV